MRIVTDRPMAWHARRVPAEATRALTRCGIGQGTEQGAGPSGVPVGDQTARIPEQPHEAGGRRAEASGWPVRRASPRRRRERPPRHRQRRQAGPREPAMITREDQARQPEPARSRESLLTFTRIVLRDRRDRGSDAEYTLP
jgi:hypothetical protein